MAAKEGVMDSSTKAKLAKGAAALGVGGDRGGQVWRHLLDPMWPGMGWV